MSLAWGLLLCLAAIWGTSFAAMEVALVDAGPLSMMVTRLWVGGAAIALWALIARVGWPLRAAWWQYVGVALIGNCVPFFWIAWGQQSISSSAAGAIMGSMPLVTAVVATLAGLERLGRRQWLGLSVGFLGLLALAYSQSGPGADGDGGLLGSVAVFGAVVCYALSTLVARFGQDKNAIRAGAATLLTAATMGSLVLIFSAEQMPRTFTHSTLAMIYLGLLPSGLAAVLYFKLVNLRGPVFLSQVNYLIPIISLTVGWLVMNETLVWGLPVGVGLILLGLYLAQQKPRVSAS